MRRMHEEEKVMKYRRDPSLNFRHFRTRQLSRSTEGRQPSKKRWDIRQGMERGARESNHLLDVENTSRMKWVFHLPRKNSPETHEVDLHLVDCTVHLTSRALLPKPILPPGGCASERTSFCGHTRRWRQYWQGRYDTSESTVNKMFNTDLWW